MPYDLNKNSQDVKRINMRQPYEIEKWMRKFECTKKDLQKAVDEVGTSAEDVENHFKNK